MTATRARLGPLPAVPASERFTIDGDLLFLGAGSVPSALWPMLLAHVNTDWRKAVVIDAKPVELPPALVAAGVTTQQVELTRDNLGDMLRKFAGRGTTIGDFTVDVSTCDMARLCQEIGVAGYLNLSVEDWPDAPTASDAVTDSLWARRQRLHQLAAGWPASRRPTFAFDIGANPGLATFWALKAIADMTTYCLRHGLYADAATAAAADKFLSERDWPRLAQVNGLYMVMDCEWDDQVSRLPREADEFVCPWSPWGCYGEAVQMLSSMGWGTGQGPLPPGAQALGDPADPAEILLPTVGALTFVLGYTPGHGSQVGMGITHGELGGVGGMFTRYDAEGRRVHAPSTAYSYAGCSDMWMSLRDCIGRGFQMLPRWRVMDPAYLEPDRADEIVMLLLGGPVGWCAGSRLTVADAGPGGPTPEQVAAGALGGFRYVSRHRNKGVISPENIACDEGHESFLGLANRYLGTIVSEPTSWTPQAAQAAYPYAIPRPDRSRWRGTQLGAFLVMN